MVYAVAVELDVETGSGEQFARLGGAWFDESAWTLAGEVRRRLESGPPLPAPWDDPSSELRPYGPPGSPWGEIHVSWTAGERLRYARRMYSAKNFAWLCDRLAIQPRHASLKLTELGSEGYPMRGLRMTVEAEERSPGWVRLMAKVPDSAFADEQRGRECQRAWLAFLGGFADKLNPGFGHIAYAFDADAKTALEHCLPQPGGRNSPWYTVGESRQWARGYGWLTIIAQELADRLGGVRALQASGAFAEVRQLANGGVWLLATADFREYGMPQAERVFRVLAPVLRPGPLRDPLNPPPLVRESTLAARAPLLLVMEDAATAQ